MSRRGRAATSNRNQFNPTFLGEFDQLSLRLLKGNFTQKHRVVGRADTSSASNGGFGGGGYNAKGYQKGGTGGGYQKGGCQ